MVVEVPLGGLEDGEYLVWRHCRVAGRACFGAGEMGTLVACDHFIESLVSDTVVELGVEVGKGEIYWFTMVNRGEAEVGKGMSACRVVVEEVETHTAWRTGDLPRCQ